MLEFTSVMNYIEMVDDDYVPKPTEEIIMMVSLIVNFQLNWTFKLCVYITKGLY